jgi:pyruvate decarboxylase
VETSDLILHIGPYPTSANTGGWTSNLPQKNLIVLHPSYCSIGEKTWKGLHFAPVIRKLTLQLEQLCSHSNNRRDGLQIEHPSVPVFTSFF